jgi:hypothetical protein
MKKNFVITLITTLIFIALVAGVNEPETRRCNAQNTIPVRSGPVSWISGKDRLTMDFIQKGMLSDSAIQKKDQKAEKPVKKKGPCKKGTTVKKPVTKNV